MKINMQFVCNSSFYSHYRNKSIFHFSTFNNPKKTHKNIRQQQFDLKFEQSAGLILFLNLKLIYFYLFDLLQFAKQTDKLYEIAIMI